MDRLAVQTFFAEMVADIGALLNCASVALVFDCPDARLAHPYLALLPPASPPPSYGAVDLITLLYDEPVRALCDIACQSGYPCTLDATALPSANEETGDIAVAPLEHSAGILGFLLLSDMEQGNLGEGEVALLRDYLASRMEGVENAVGFICNASNLSARKDDEAVSMPVLDEQRSEFIAMITHELRSPLAAIKGYAGLLQAYSAVDSAAQQRPAIAITPDRQQRYLNTIMEQTRHLEVLLGDLLDISRMQAGKLALRFTSVDAGALCQRVIYLARLRIPQSASYSITCHLSPDLPVIWADPHRLQQVLTNVVDNAIKYSPGGGVIDIATNVFPSPVSERESASQVGITVTDQGIGIPKSQRSLLFRPFRRLDHPQVKRVPGMGLGLYLARTLVEAMQGTLDLQSSEGAGTTILLRFPAHAQKQVHPPASCSLALSLRES